MRASSRACSYSWQPWEELQPPHSVALTDSVDILTTPYTYHCQWKEGKGRLKKGANDTNGTQPIKAQCTHSHSERLQARISLTQTTPKLHLVPIFHYTVTFIRCGQSRNSILWRKKGQNTFKFQAIEKLKPQNSVSCIDILNEWTYSGLSPTITKINTRSDDAFCKAASTNGSAENKTGFKLYF